MNYDKVADEVWRRIRGKIRVERERQHGVA